MRHPLSLSRRILITLVLVFSLLLSSCASAADVRKFTDVAAGSWYYNAVAYATEYMGLTKAEGLVLGTIRTAMSSVADMCIIQMPDWLDLGDEARMNFPGTLSDCNWTWRAKKGAMSKTLAKKIYAMTKLYGRLGNQK